MEELERQHRGEIPRDQMPKPAGAEAPPSSSINGGIISQSLASKSAAAAHVAVAMKPASSSTTTTMVSSATHNATDEPQSPNTLLKQTLKIGAKVPCSTSASTSTVLSPPSDSQNKPLVSSSSSSSLGGFGHKLSSVVEASSSGHSAPAAGVSASGRGGAGSGGFSQVRFHFRPRYFLHREIEKPQAQPSIHGLELTA